MSLISTRRYTRSIRRPSGRQRAPSNVELPRIADDRRDTRRRRTRRAGSRTRSRSALRASRRSPSSAGRPSRPIPGSSRAAPRAVGSIGRWNRTRLPSLNRAMTGSASNSSQSRCGIAERPPATRRCTRRNEACRAAGTRRAATRCWRSRIPARSGPAALRLGDAELRRTAAGDSSAACATRSPSAAIVSAAARIRASSPSVRKNGRRNGQCTRSPNVSFRARIDAANVRAERAASARRRAAAGRATRSIAIHGQLRFGSRPGAPVNPDAGPMPSISSHRGQHCDGWPLSARSITSFAIFSTTWVK